MRAQSSKSQIALGRPQHSRSAKVSLHAQGGIHTIPPIIPPVIHHIPPIIYS